jgi:hypothetical protein
VDLRGDNFPGKSKVFVPFTSQKIISASIASYSMGTRFFLGDREVGT